MRSGEADSLNKLWTKNYIFILLANLFVYLGFYLLVPTLPAYAKQIGSSSLEASLVVSIFSISALVLRLVTGNLADRVSLKLLIIIGLVILAACSFSYLFLTIIEIILVRILQGVGWGMSSTSIATAVSNIVPNQKRGEGMGYYSLSMIVSMSLAPVVAIMIMNVSSFSVIAIASIVFVLVGSFLIFAVSTPKNAITEKKSKTKIAWSELFEKKAILPSFLCFLLAITLCGIMSYIMLFGKEIKITNIWIYFIGHVSMILLTRPFVGKLFDKKGHAFVILPGVIFMITGLIVLSYTHSIITLVIAALFYGFGYGAVQPSLQVWAVNRSPAERKGAANGTFLSSMDLGFTIGPILLSFVAESKSYAVMYRFSSVFMVAFLFVYMYHLVKEKRNKIILEDLEEEIA